VRSPSTTGYFMSQFSQSILNTLQSREFYRVTPPPPKPTHSTMPASQPAGRPWSNSSATGSQTSPTYFEEVPVKVPRNPPLLRAVPPRNAADDAQRTAVAEEAARLLHRQAAPQTSNGKPPFHPFHPGLTPRMVANTRFSRQVQDIFDGYRNCPERTDQQQAMNLIALRAAGFPMSAHGSGLNEAIRKGLHHATELKSTTRDPSQPTWSGVIEIEAPLSPYRKIPCHVTVVCPENEYPLVIQARPLPYSAPFQRQ
jgi:hypothetical protein